MLGVIRLTIAEGVTLYRFDRVSPRSEFIRVVVFTGVSFPVGADSHPRYRGSRFRCESGEAILPRLRWRLAASDQRPLGIGILTPFSSAVLTAMS